MMTTFWLSWIVCAGLSPDLRSGAKKRGPGRGVRAEFSVVRESQPKVRSLRKPHLARICPRAKKHLASQIPIQAG
jgi:hypothetical protein